MFKKSIVGIVTAGIAFTVVPPAVQEQHHEVIDLHAGHDHSDEELEYMAANGMSNPVGNELLGQINFQPCSTITWGFDRSDERPGVGGQRKDGVVYAIRATLGYLSRQSGLTFVESPGIPTGSQSLRFRYKDLPGTIWGTGGGTPMWGGVVNLDHSFGGDRIDANTYSGTQQALILHEVMHAMGFGHQKSEGSIMYRTIGWRSDLGPIDRGLLAKYYPRTNCPPPPAPEPEPEVAPTPPPPPPVPEDRTGWLMRDTVSPNLLIKGRANSFKFIDGYYKNNMTGSNWTVKKKNKVTLDCTIPEGTPKGNRKGCTADYTLHVFELTGRKKGKRIDMGKTVTVPKDKGKYIVVVASEEPTRYNKNQGRIVWMVKR
jgi:hypothetical protein